jgi:hypothetical protein
VSLKKKEADEEEEEEESLQCWERERVKSLATKCSAEGEPREE